MVDDSTLWQSTTREEFEIRAGVLLEEHATPIYFIPVLSRENPCRVLGGSENVLIEERDGFSVLEYLPLYPQDGRADSRPKAGEPGGTVFVFSTDIRSVWFFLTLAGNQFIRQRLDNSLERARRAMPRFTLTNSDMLAVLDGLASTSDGGDLISEHAVLRSRGDRANKGDRANSDYKLQKYVDVFHWATERGDLVHRIRLKNSASGLEFMLYRDGSVRLFSGNWRAFSDHLRSPILAKAGQRIQMYSDRARESFESVGHPLEIRFTDDVFKDKADNMSLVAALQSIGHGCVTLMHANPYLHAVVVDMVDGASSDVFVTSARTVAVIPGYDTTEGSLLRIVRSIQDGICEGEVVSQPEKVVPSLDEIMGVASA